MSQVVTGFWLTMAVLAANLPWLSERWLFVLTRREGQTKPFWWRLVEWALLYGLTLGMGFGVEYKVTGGVHSQDWEFYTVTLCLFIVGAVPGFIYRYQLQRLLEQVGR